MTCVMTLAFIHLLPSVVQSLLLSECIKGGAHTHIVSNDMQQSSQAARRVVLLFSWGFIEASLPQLDMKFHFLVLPSVCLHDREINLLG